MLDILTALNSYLVAALFILLAGIETFRPAFALAGGLTRRWIGNLGLYAMNIALVVALAAIGLTGTDLPALNLFAPLIGGLPVWAQGMLAFLALDLFHYSMHRLSHRLAPFWWLHGVHHADIDLDVTTGLRHHPGEAAVTYLLSLALMWLLGLPPIIVAIYALAAKASALIQHANLRCPESLDRALRTVIVTPGMHRHHHAQARAIHDSNYGTVFAFWDRLFRTYHDSDPTIRDVQPIGLTGLGTPADQRLDGVLLMPYRLFSRNSP